MITDTFTAYSLHLFGKNKAFYDVLRMQSMSAQVRKAL